MEIWKLTYDLTLIPLIAGGIGMIAVMIYRKQYKWGIFFSGVFFAVLQFEALGVFENGKTISSQYGEWAQNEPFWAYTSLALMVTWMASLFFHLLAAGMRKRKKP